MLGSRARLAPPHVHPSNPPGGSSSRLASLLLLTAPAQQWIGRRALGVLVIFQTNSVVSGDGLAQALQVIKQDSQGA